MDTSGRYMWDKDGDPDGWDYHTNPIGAENQKRKYTVQSRVGRYLDNANYILDGVCDGHFPKNPNVEPYERKTPKPPPRKRTKKELEIQKKLEQRDREKMRKQGYHTEEDIEKDIKSNQGYWEDVSHKLSLDPDECERVLDPDGYEQRKNSEFDKKREEERKEKEHQEEIERKEREDDYFADFSPSYEELEKKGLL